LQAHLRDFTDPQTRDAAREAQHLLDGVRGYSAYLVDRGGRIIEHTADLKPADMAAVVAPGGGQQFDTAQLPTIGHVRRLTAPLSDTGRTIVLLAELEHVDEELWEVIRALLITTPITLVAAASIAYFLAYKSLSPVDHLRQMTDEITAERLDRRLPVGNASDELGLLAQTINSMIARLERSFSEVRRFTADASHELRTPVSVIRSEAELGLGELKGDDPARRRLESIVEECGRLAELTTQLLTLCRQEAGLAQLIRLPVSLRTAISDSTESVRSMAEAKQQRIITDLQDGVAVLGDAARLHQVFTNLLQNAVKYTPPGGTITLKLRQTNGQAVITVQDTGIGIPPEHLTRVFDRFYQVDTGHSHAEGGAGLGLSIARSIIEAHGGQIAVTSEAGVGSAFQIALPVALNDGRDEVPHSPSAEEAPTESSRTTSN
jgi:signal transduction histidine kinase